MNNIMEKVSGNDMFDIAHVRAVPYVDAVTMDANTADLCRRAARRLRAKAGTLDYAERIFTSLKELLGTKF